MDRSFQEIYKEKMDKIYAHREKYLEAWISETGMLPSECMLMQQEMGAGITRMWVERKPPEPLVTLEPETLKKWMDSMADIEDCIIRTRKKLHDLSNS